MARVAFHQEPNEFQECKPRKLCYLYSHDPPDIYRNFINYDSSIGEIIVDYNFNGMTPLYISPRTSVQYKYVT